MSWVPPLLLALIAACAAWVAFQQWVVARQKLNHDLFDRRFAVYTAAEKYLVACLNRNGGTQEDTSISYQEIKAAPFLFDKSVNDFLALIMKHSINIQVFGKHVEMTHIPDWQKHMDTYHASQQWVGEAFGSLNSVFQQSLNLSTTIPFPVIPIASVPNAEALRKKALATLAELQNHFP